MDAAQTPQFTDVARSLGMQPVVVRFAFTRLLRYARAAISLRLVAALSRRRDAATRVALWYLVRRRTQGHAVWVADLWKAACDTLHQRTIEDKNRQEKANAESGASSSVARHSGLLQNVGVRASMLSGEGVPVDYIPFSSASLELADFPAHGSGLLVARITAHPKGGRRAHASVNRLRRCSRGASVATTEDSSSDTCDAVPAGPPADSHRLRRLLPVRAARYRSNYPSDGPLLHPRWGPVLLYVYGGPLRRSRVHLDAVNPLGFRSTTPSIPAEALPGARCRRCGPILEMLFADMSRWETQFTHGGEIFLLSELDLHSQLRLAMYFVILCPKCRDVGHAAIYKTPT